MSGGTTKRSYDQHEMESRNAIDKGDGSYTRRPTGIPIEGVQEVQKRLNNEGVTPEGTTRINFNTIKDGGLIKQEKQDNIKKFSVNSGTLYDLLNT